MKYIEAKDSLRSDQGEVTPKSSKEDRLAASARFVIQLIEEGKNLTKLPTDSKVIPPLAQILDFIDRDQKLSQEYDKAQNMRIVWAKEQMLAAQESFTTNPSPDNKDYYQAAERTYSNLAKAAPQQDANVSIEFHGIMPAELWDNIGKDSDNASEEDNRADNSNKE